MTAAGVEAPFFRDRLQRALQSNEIEILFQPQVELATGCIAGVEALARWRQPAIGELGVEALFDAAAKAGLAKLLSEHVQRRAIAAAAAWPSGLSKLRVSVNVTAADTVRTGFADQFLAMVKQSGFDPVRVMVEITETELIENLDVAAHMLGQLREAGVRTALDDFGTGYSSLLYLKALPLDGIKIDKQLTEDITGSERDRTVICGVIAMARALGLAITAEGVETEEQLRLLSSEGCTYYQGYLCSPPVDSAALVKLIEGWERRQTPGKCLNR
jgi:EAL domain-containing protein (putative c-di-GMP-specific phosphodiesterase class I)